MNIREKSKEASRSIRQYVLSRMASGQLRPGDKLPTERELTAMFGGGRGTVRKTLLSLEEDGLLLREVGRGTFVKRVATPPGNGAGEPAPAAMGLSAEAIIAKLASPQDVMELRLMLEPEVTRLVVSRASKAEIETMYECLDKARRSTTLEEFEHWDDMLHQSIAAAARNPFFRMIYSLISVVRLESSWGELKRRTLTDALKKSHFDEHVRIVQAIDNRDASGAYAEMLRHLQHVKKNMLG